MGEAYCDGTCFLKCHFDTLGLVFVIIRKRGLGADIYIKPDFSFLIYGSWAWSVGFGELKTDLAFLFIR